MNDTKPHAARPVSAEALVRHIAADMTTTEWAQKAKGSRGRPAAMNPVTKQALAEAYDAMVLAARQAVRSWGEEPGKPGAR